ncbi:uncharacterized [Tachysurus ichikawai]
MIFDFTEPKLDSTRALLEASLGTQSVAECSVDLCMAATIWCWKSTTLYDAFYWGLAQATPGLWGRLQIYERRIDSPAGN